MVSTHGMLFLYFHLIIFVLKHEYSYNTLLVFVSDRGAYAKEESLETYIKQQFGTETTTETNISPGIPAEPDLKKRRAS